MKIIKPDNDYRVYSYEILENGIEAVFIHDPKAIMSAASLAVGAGSYEDTVFGIAHFLEHMLFMGNKKYPDEKYYHNYIISHGGFTNAYTAGDHTNYYFNIDKDYFLKALDIFSNFFLEPLFEKSAIEREMNSVDSEHRKNIPDDNWRIFQMIRNICLDKSPLSKFATGSLETLNIPDIREKVISFYDKYYSSNIMKLVILYNGNDFENTIDKVKKMFNLIKNKNVKINREFNGSHLNLNKIIKIKPISDEEIFTLIFEIKINDEIKNNNLLQYISYLLNHEGEGTLQNKLYKLGYIKELRCSEDCVIDGTCIYSVRFRLNNNSDINCILDAYKKYINILIETVMEKKSLFSLLEEDRYLSQQSFQEKIIEDEADFVSELNEDLISFQNHREYLLAYKYLVGEFLDKDQIINNMLSILSDLNLSNKRFSVLDISKKNKEGDQEEKFYNIKYIIEDYELPKKSTYLGIMNFPEKNKFIIKKKILLKEKSDKIPQKIEFSDKIDCYLKKNFDLKTKFTELLIQIEKQDLYDNIDNYLQYIFIISLFNLIFNSYLFDITKANYNFAILKGKNHFILNLSGYYEKLGEILNTILEKIRSLYNPEVTSKFFEIVKEQLIDIYKNRKYKSPARRVFSCRDELLYNKYFTDEEILDKLEKITSLNLNVNIFDYNKIILYAEGNLDNETFTQIYKIINTKFKYIPKNNSIMKINLTDKISKKIDKIYHNQNKDEINDVTLLSIFIDNIYVGSDWIKNYCLILILHQLINTDFFDKIRTREQIGYLVRSTEKVIGEDKNKALIYEFLVQSSKKDYKYIEDRIKKFIKTEIIIILDNIQIEDFDEVKNSIKEKVLKPFNNLIDSSMYYFDKISNKNYMYNFNSIIASYLDDISLDDIKEFYKTKFNLNTYINVSLIKN